MTTMDIAFAYAGSPSDDQLQALARLSDVYGIRKLRIDEAAHTLAIEYDATRMDSARVEALVRSCGLAPLPAPIRA